ncbi:hypothetical protein CkaCkLH20_11888 [Colletotrichum karsti]|uniref:Uncharacterized protein n=1 Tax=Colletotrichum karsti TaxID=1095194 RepID=A0A9P6HTE1_9PEZI|nr:uncharacterized protein CkaCkLH20_11888 [Colletotrichum karsti]KAF9870582.1 hypothetical protein CkaCkLH20_11888 [Colletotrichum karsti]
MQTDDSASLATLVDSSSVLSEEDDLLDQQIPSPTEDSDTTSSATLVSTGDNKCDSLLPQGSELSESIHDDQPQLLSEDRLAIAGIDLGSAVTRVTLAHTARRAYCDVDCPPGFAKDHASFEFPAVADVNTEKMGHDALVAGIPIKTLMYELVRLEDPSPRNDVNVYVGVNFRLLRDRGVPDASMSVLRDKGRIRQLVVEYFKKIRHSMMICCTREKLFYESVAITISAIWNTTHFKRLFMEILIDVFPFIPRRNIFLVPKAEAIGCVITNGITMDQVRDPRNEFPLPDEIMVINFGRHALHGTRLTLVWNDTEQHRVNSNADFFASKKSWGMLGGIEVYAQTIEEAIRDPVTGNPAIVNHPKKEEYVAELMTDFRRKYPYLGRTPFTLNSSGGNWDSKMLAPHLWDTAFRQPLEFVHQQMRERERTGLPTIVSLTGSSYRNNAVLAATLAVVRSHAKYGWTHFTPFDDGRLLAVRGAAWAVRERKDVRTFCDTSRLELSYFWIKEPHKRWSQWWSKQVTTLTFYRDSFLCLACEPYASPPRKTVYELAQLGHRHKGKYVFRRVVRFDEEKQQHTLVLEESELDRKTGEMVSRVEWVIPMYYDVGRRTPLLDDFDFDLGQLDHQAK